MAASSIAKWVFLFVLISGLLLQNHVEAQEKKEEAKEAKEGQEAQEAQEAPNGQKQPCKVFCGLFGLSNNRRLLEAPALAPKAHHHKHHKKHHKGDAAHKHHEKSAPAHAPANAKGKHY